MSIRPNLALTIFLFLTACSGEKAFEGLASTNSYTGALIITSMATDPQTGPGMASIFDAQGVHITTLKDYYSGAESPTGSAFISPNKVLISVDGADRVDSFDLDTGVVSPYVLNSGLSASPLKQMARSSVDGSIYVVEYNTHTVEKFYAGGVRSGAPFIPTTVGSCTLHYPYSIAFNSTNENVIVLSYGSSGRISIYDKNGNCVRHFTTSPMDTGTPSGVAYHALSNKLIVTRAGDSSIWSVNLDGTSPTQIFMDTTIISIPRAVTVDAAGYIYVGSNGTDTIEKLYYSGTGLATRALSDPLVGPGVYSQNPSSITVIE